MSVPTETRCTACGRTATAADRYCGHCGSRLDTESVPPTVDGAQSTGEHRPHVDRIMTALRSATMGEYDVAGELGRGGMAVVFLAHDLSLNRKVAIKVLLPELLYTEGMDRRFKHEARIAAKLDHPNILVIHGVREANELLFIVMKLVDGLPLSTIARAAGPLPVPVVRLIIRSVADALAYAHGEGVVHRDVKPANIMVDRRGNVIVMDFGIAKAADDAHLTRTGLVIGTPAYMSPEQCLAHGVAPASDQYSLGVVAYELLTGRTPFRGSALEMQWAHATAGPPALRTLRPDCPAELESLVMRMLAKAPTDRWPTLHDVADTVADDAATASAARAALVALVSDVPGRRGDAMPVTPASPLPMGVAPAVAGNATTQPAAVADWKLQADLPGIPALTLSQQRIELATGDSVELIVELADDEQATTGTKIEWTSSDPAIASVSPDGFVTAVAPGLAEVACSWRGKRAVCLVNVSVAPAAAVAVPVALPVTAPVAVPPAATAIAAPASRSSTAARLRHRWLVGMLAASVAGIALYAGLKRSSSERSTPSTDIASAPPSAPVGSAPVTSVPALAAPAALVATPPSAPSDSVRRALGRRDSSAAPRPGRPAVTGARSAATPPVVRPTPPPAVPLARPDTLRLTPNASDSTRYAATRPAAPASPPPATAPPAYSPPAPAPPRDSVAARLPAPTKDIASALFKEFAAAINARVYSRITAAYSQPSDAGEVKTWQDFLLLVRDYTPRATVRSASVDATTNPPTITAAISFQWTTDAGFDRVRAGTFVGVAHPILDGWELRDVRLVRKFW